MADLSQDEIDSLISGAIPDDDDMGIGGGGVEEDAPLPPARVMGEAKGKKVSSYDFRMPSPIPEEQKKTITLLHEIYAQKIKVNLSSFLRSDLDIVLQSVEQLTYNQYTSSLSSPTCIATFDMPPLNGYGLVEINAIVAYSFIDKLLGGDGSVPEEVRHFTDVELAIVRKIIDTMLLDLSDTWKTVLNVSFNPKEIQTNPAMVRIIPMKEVTVIITFSVKVADSSGLITICIPYANLEPIAFKLGNQQWHKYAAKQSEEIQAAHMNNFHNVPLDVTAILGKMDLPMEEVLALQAGDILDLGSKTSDPVTVRIASKDKYYANPGLLSKHKAVSILKEVEKE